MFDSIEKGKIEYVLRMQGIPEKLASLVSLTLAETYFEMLFHGKASDLFRVETGVNQEMRCLRHNLILGYVIKNPRTSSRAI